MLVIPNRASVLQLRRIEIRLPLFFVWRKSEKSLEPFSSKIGISLLLGPFQANFGTKRPENQERGFFRKNRHVRFFPL